MNDGDAALPGSLRAAVGVVLIAAGVVLAWQNGRVGTWLRQRAAQAAQGLGETPLFRPTSAGRYPAVLIEAALTVFLGALAFACSFTIR